MHMTNACDSDSVDKLNLPLIGHHKKREAVRRLRKKKPNCLATEQERGRVHTRTEKICLKIFKTRSDNARN